MATVNCDSLRNEFDAKKADIDSHLKNGEITEDAYKSITGVYDMMEVMMAIFLEKKTKKNSKNSSIPPSQTDKDETKKPPRKPLDPNRNENSRTSENFETVTIEEVSTVETCGNCGNDLSDVEPSAREERVLFDLSYKLTKYRVEAEIKDCPECRSRTKGSFPENMPGPLQYGNGIKALSNDLLVAQMLSLRRSTELIYAITGIKISEATSLSNIKRLFYSLQSWKDWTKKQLLTRPALHVDETGFRVEKKTWWLHVATDGTLTLKYLHRKRGKEAIEDFGIIPFYFGVLIHDRWGSYFLYDQCKHQVCGSHLLRDLAFVIDSNNYRWARLMKKLLCEICDKVNKSETKVLSEAECRRYVKRYRTILTQGAKEMPKILRRSKGQRGRVAQTFAHNLHQAMLILEESVLRFMSDPDVSFTNNTGEQKIRMSKVKIKVSGCFRTKFYAQAWCLISSNLDSAKAIGYNPHVAIQIALDGNAVDIFEEYEQAA